MFKYENIYILALSIIALSISANQYVTQRFILTTKQDSRIINISGRQRMLSQKICKASIATLTAKDSLNFHRSKKELKTALKQFIKAHRALQFGDVELGISKINSSEIISTHFNDLKPFYIEMTSSAEKLAKDVEFDTRQDVIWLQYLNIILKNETSFLSIMNNITFQYDKEAYERMNQLSMIEYILYAFALLLLILEAFLIFRPALLRLRIKTRQLIDKERELAQAKSEQNYIDELKAKNEELERFTYITSHDLQEPLNSIISFSHFLKQSDYKLDKEAHTYIDIIVKLSYRMKNFITSLLEYGKIGKEKEKRNIHLNQIILNLEEGLNGVIKKTNTNFSYLGKDIVLKVYESDFYKLLLNLIINGIKYQNKNSRPEITIDAQDYSNEVLFSVKDNGIGIDSKYFNKIFEVFHRLHTRDKFDGTGIGLSYCKKIVELHGGSIWLESELDKGTTFYFTIPKT